MKRLPFIICVVAFLLGLLLLWIATPPAKGDYLGSWKIDDVVEIRATTSQFSTGNKCAASPIQCKVYEGSTAAEIVDVNMTQFDSKIGFYAYSLTLASGTGFEKGKHYTVLIEASVDGVTANTWHNFQIGAEVDADTVSDKTGYALTQTFPTNFSSQSIDANGTVQAEVKGISGSDTAADNAELMFNGTGYAGGTTKLGTSVVQWNGSTNGIANWITVFSTDFATDYNETLNMWSTNVKYVNDETPEADVVDTLLDVNDNLEAEIAAVQSTANTIDGYLDTEIALILAEIAEADANSELILADTAAMQPIIADIAGLSEIGDKVVADMDANSLLANWTAQKAGYLDMKISDVNASGGDANIAISEFVIRDTNVAAAGTALTFTLTAGKASADAYAWHLITVTDANDSNRETRLILTWTAGRVVTVNEPFSFTPAVGDAVRIWAVGYFRRARNPLTDPINY